MWNRGLTEDEVKRQMDLDRIEFLAVMPDDKFAATWGTLKGGI